MLFSMMPSVWLLGVPLAPVVADAGVVTLAQVPAWLGLLVTLLGFLLTGTGFVWMMKGDLGVLRSEQRAFGRVLGEVKADVAGLRDAVADHIQNDHAPHAAMLFTQREAEESRRTADAEHKALRAEVAALRK